MTRDEALAWIADIFEESPDDVSAETPRTDLPAWDSLGVLTLMASLDSDFDILLSEEDMLALDTVGDILEVLEKHGKVA